MRHAFLSKEAMDIVVIESIAVGISVAQFCQVAAPGEELPATDADESGGEWQLR